LVVIGILIAIQLDDLNDRRKERDLEMKILQEIIQNIQTDFEDHNQNLQFMRNTVRASEVVLNHLENRLPYKDSLDGHFVWLAIIPDFYSLKSGYQLLTSKGVNLIGNDSLRQDISFLYDNTYPWIEDWFIFLKGNSYRLLTENMVAKFYDLNPLDSYKPRNYKGLQDDEEFQSYVQFNMSYFQAFMTSYEERLKEVHLLEERIEKEIEFLSSE